MVERLKCSVGHSGGSQGTLVFWWAVESCIALGGLKIFQKKLKKVLTRQGAGCIMGLQSRETHNTQQAMRREGMTMKTSKMNINQLRDLAVSLGADRKKLYGTSRTAMVLIIDRLKKEQSIKIA